MNAFRTILTRILSTIGYRARRTKTKETTDPWANLCEEIDMVVHSEFYGRFTDVSRIPEIASEVFSDDADSVKLSQYGQEVVTRLVEDYRKIEATWPEVTDCDHLDAAFKELNKKGIIARQNYWCCSTCAGGAIWEEVEQAMTNGQNVRGYTFYNEQDTQSAVEDNKFHLDYGSIHEGEKENLEIAHEIIDVLKGHSLTVDWNGKWERRIGVTLDWMRRRKLPDNDNWD